MKGVRVVRSLNVIKKVFVEVFGVRENYFFVVMGY